MENNNLRRMRLALYQIMEIFVKFNVILVRKLSNLSMIMQLYDESKFKE